MYYNWRNKDCEYCPYDKPVVIGYECGPCEDGTIYDQYQNKCLEFKTLNIDECPISYQYNSNEKKCKCPLSNPFDDG